MKSKYKKVLFSLLVFGGNVRYMSLLHFSLNSYCGFFLFLFICSTIYIYMNNLVYIVNNIYKENHQGPRTHKQKLKNKVIPEGVTLFIKQK